jgi:peptidoglycan/xylan/chitin deacetylase (PgdA/CDA1 family)
MSATGLWPKIKNKYRNLRSASQCRRPFLMQNNQPVISFTFDDVPKSSCVVGAEILESYGLTATYYVSMCLMDRNYEIGPAFTKNNLDIVVAAGHEIGCHTYDHLDAWNTDPNLFDKSIIKNQTKFSEMYPGRSLRTFSYPINMPSPKIKRRAGDHYVCCRAGGQTYNVGRVDLNLLKAFFVDQRNRGDCDSIFQIIIKNHDNYGWLIFCTHDIAESPSPYGCSPELFEEIVRLSSRSGARIMPVYEACIWLGITRQSGDESSRS